jgi:hypothetical protein
MHATTILRIARSVRLQIKHNIKTIIPNIIVPQLSVSPNSSLMTSVNTARYHPKSEPAPWGVHPYHIIHDPKLADRMISSLRVYLQASPTGGDSPSTNLQASLDSMEGNIDRHPALGGGLTNEKSSAFYWDCFQPVISDAVEQIDQNLSVPRYSEQSRIFSIDPDAIIHPSRFAGPRLLREHKSPSVFEHHAPKIVEMGKGMMNGQHGSPLYLDEPEEGHRSILFKVNQHYSSLDPTHTQPQIGIAMVASPGGPIPYAILFGGHQFMLFSLFHNIDSNGETRYGLFCSDIIKTSNKLLPIIPLAIFMLLGKDAPATLIPSPISIPSVAPGQMEKKVRKKRTAKKKITQLLQTFMRNKVSSDI